MRSRSAEIPFVLLPNGSSNGLSASFGFDDAFHAMESLLCKIERPRPMDLMKFIVGVGKDDEEEQNLEKAQTPQWECSHVSTLSIVHHDIIQEHKLRGLGLPVAVRDYLAVLVTLICSPLAYIKVSCLVDDHQHSHADYNRGALFRDDGERKKELDGKGSKWVTLPVTRTHLLAVSNIPKISSDILVYV